LVTLLCVGIAAGATAQPNDYDFDFTTITHPNNPGFSLEPPGQYHHGRGSVGYEYRMSKFEISTTQWLEFANAVAPKSPQWALAMDADRWGARLNSSTFTYELRTDIDCPGDVHVGGMSFGQAAMYCNWLHNGKKTDDASLSTGAYDIVDLQMGRAVVSNYQHLPGADYWIPTMDEWMKAVYWDPNKATDDGWWWFPHMSDDFPVHGPPGVGETSTGYLDTRDDWFEFRIGDYPDTVTPWGLIDATGGVQEWTESELTPGDGRLIRKGGSLGDLGLGTLHLDQANALQSAFGGNGRLNTGLRIASAVPAPGSVTTFMTVIALNARRRVR